MGMAEFIFDPTEVRACADALDDVSITTASINKGYRDTDAVVGGHGWSDAAGALTTCTSAWSGRVRTDAMNASATEARYRQIIVSYVGTDADNAHQIRKGK
jgi:Na+/H+-translocating membrane pyrophosphatase